MAQPNRRVVLISYTYRPAARIVSYAHFLREHGLDVDLIVWDADAWRGFRPQLPPEVRLFPVREAEERFVVRRLESLAVRRIPRGLLARAHRVTAGNSMARRLSPAVSSCERVYLRVSNPFHDRVFMRAYTVMRPLLLARATRKMLNGVDFGTVDRIVATDMHAIPSAWRLAQKHPTAAAASTLDRHPYLEASEQPAATAA